MEDRRFASGCLKVSLPVLIGVGLVTGLLLLFQAPGEAALEPPGPRISKTITFPPGVGIEPGGVAISPRTGYVYVANRGSNEVSVISGTEVITNLVSDRLMDLSGREGNHGLVYASPIIGLSSTVNVVSGTRVVASPMMKHRALDVAFDPDNGYAYVTDGEGVAVLRDANVIAYLTADTGASPGFDLMELDPASGYLYVAARSLNAIAVISGTRVTAMLLNWPASWVSATRSRSPSRVGRPGPAPPSHPTPPRRPAAPPSRCRSPPAPRWDRTPCRWWA